MHTNPARGAVILVADDVIGNIRLLKNALQDLATVVFAQDGVEALLQTERHRPDLILLDVLMPKLDGFETCRRLKANPATKGIPVIFITAAAAETDEAAGLTVGAIDYIAKPFAPAIVRARVQNQLALVRATAALHSTNDALRKFKAAVDCSRSAIIITDRDVKVEYVNAAFSRMSGFAAADVVGRAPALLTPPQSTPSSEALTRALQKGSDWRGELQTKRQDGSLTWQDIAVAPITDHAGLITHFVAIAADIDQQKAMEADLQRLAVTDPLTGVANRRRLFEQGESEILRTRRTGEPTAMLMLDIDHFKQINDAHGHPAGDAVIRALATEATKMVRAIDTVGRFGGEEFAILLPLTGAPGAIDIAERLRASVAALAVTWQQEVISFTVSIGVAVATTSTTDFDKLVTMADTALYRAKKAGRNRVARDGAAD